MGKHIPPPPGPGRPKGSKNKALPWLNDAISIYEERGGKAWLSKWIDANNINLREFMRTILIIAAKQVAEKQEQSGETTMKVNVHFIDVKGEKV
jgi:hypothetical protein